MSIASAEGCVMKSKMQTQCSQCGAVFLVQMSDRGKVVRCAGCQSKFRIQTISRYRFRTSYGVSEPVTPFVVRQAIQDGAVLATDAVSKNDGPWTPCQQLGIDWPNEFRDSPQTNLVTYDETAFEQAVRDVGEHDARTDTAGGQHDVLATYSNRMLASQSTEAAALYTILVSSSQIELYLEQVHGKEVVEVDHLTFEHSHSEQTAEAVIPRNHQGLSIPALYDNLLGSRSNQLNVIARVKIHDPSLEQDDFSPRY